MISSHIVIAEYRVKGVAKFQHLAHSPRTKTFEFLIDLDHFLKFLKYFKYFEKLPRLPQNSDFFVCGEQGTLFHHFKPLSGLR